MTEPHDTDALLALDAAIDALEAVPGRAYSAGILRQIRSGWQERQRLRLHGLTSAADTAREAGYGTPARTEDPRDYGLTAVDLCAVADRLYDAGDSRLEPMRDVSARFGHIRSRLRGLADAIDQEAR